MQRKYSGKTIVVTCAVILCAGPALPGACMPLFESGRLSSISPRSGLKQLTFHIQKLSCASCARNIQRAIAGLPGVKYAAIELHLPWDADGKVIFDSKRTSPSEISSAIRAQRYYESDVKEMQFRR